MNDLGYHRRKSAADESEDKTHRPQRYENRHQNDKAGKKNALVGRSSSFKWTHSNALLAAGYCPIWQKIAFSAIAD